MADDNAITEGCGCVLMAIAFVLIAAAFRACGGL